MILLTKYYNHVSIYNKFYEKKNYRAFNSDHFFLSHQSVIRLARSK